MLREEDLNLVKDVNDILEKELVCEMKKIKEAGKFAPGQTKTLDEAADCMLKMKELEERFGNGDSGYSQRSYHNMPYARYQNPSYGYNFNRSGHSTRDRMVARLEDLMGDVKNEYEAQMISDVIRYIQTSER